jgi:phosphatidylglycerophosphatase A
VASSILADRIPGAPSWRFVASHPAHAVALVGGLGLIPIAPGTFGTLAAFPLHTVAASYMHPYAHLMALAAAFALGVWAGGRTSRDLGVHDHGAIVWDETVAFALVLFLAPPGPLWQAAAFALFRAFDIVKPQPVRYFDRNMKGGLGVMFDDLVAAGYSVLCLAALKVLID